MFPENLHIEKHTLLNVISEILPTCSEFLVGSG